MQRALASPSSTCASTSSTRASCSTLRPNIHITRTGAQRASRQHGLGMAARRTLHAKHTRIAASNSATSSSQATIDGLKRQVKQLSGSTYGHDLSDAQRQQVEAVLQQLIAQGPGQQPTADALTGSTWRPLYTNSTGTSSGKVGPFITDVIQVFPESAPGTYYNRSTLGLVSAQLSGRYSVDGARINLEFTDLAVAIGPLALVRKAFEAGQMVGHWQTSFTDDTLRVFYSNKGNIFCLERS